MRRQVGTLRRATFLSPAMGFGKRWQGRACFTILETGFGLGLNFLATWLAWQNDAQRCAQLHFVSLEKHPFHVDDLALVHDAWPEFALIAEELLSLAAVGRW